MITAIIPCHNEEKFIGSIVRKALNYVDNMVVIDNVSTDNTGSIALDNGATVVKCSIKGCGLAIRTGIDFALRNNRSKTFVIIDGDGQHDPEDIPCLIKPLQYGIADFVIGNRFDGLYTGPRYRNFGIKFFNLVYNIGMPVKIKDTQCGFRAFNRHVASNIDLTENGFAISIEQLIKVNSNGYRVSQVPVKCIYNNGHTHSTNPLLHGLQISKAIIKWRIK